jgi:hypothetical protein
MGVRELGKVSQRELRIMSDGRETMQDLVGAHNLELIADLAIKARDDALEALGRTIVLSPGPAEATMVSMLAFALLRAHHEAVVEAMGDSPYISSGKVIADEVSETIKGRKVVELKTAITAFREALKRK